MYECTECIFEEEEASEMLHIAGHGLLIRSLLTSLRNSLLLRSRTWRSASHIGHGSHTSSNELSCLESLLHLLLAQFLSNVETEWNGTLGFCTVFGMVAAERNELLADGTTTVRLPLARARMSDDALHLLARR